MNRKAGGRFEIKDAEKGTFVAVFAKYNVIDKDRDVTHPGAFPEGKRVPVSGYNHSSMLEGKAPVGSAAIKQTSTEAQAHGRYWLDTPEGDAAWSTQKRMQDDGIPSEWSYGYDPLDFSFGEFEGQQVRFLKSVDVFEVSPVLRGAGVDTRTVDVKSRALGGPAHSRVYSGVLPPHDTGTSDAGWAASVALSALGIDPEVTALRAAHAYHDPDGSPDRKASYAFLHHDPDGAASIRACLLGIAALNGAKGPRVPDAARRGVWEHLAAHLRDAEREPPALREPGTILKTADQAMVVLADLGELIEHCREVGASRALKGRGLTKTNVEILDWIAQSLEELRSLMDTPEEATARELVRAMALSNGLTGV